MRYGSKYSSAPLISAEVERPPTTPIGDRVADRSALAFAILAAAAELGLLANGLLRVQWGVNLALWVGGLVLALLWISHNRRQALGGEPLFLGMTAVFLAGGLALRDAGALAVLNTFGVLSALVLLAMVVLGGPAASIGQARVRDCIHAVWTTGWRTALGGFPLLFRDARTRSLDTGPAARTALALLRGALLATPLLVVFGSLFMAADAAFNELVLGLVGFDVEVIASHAAIILIFAWISAGYLHGVMLAPAPAPIPDPEGVVIGPVEGGAVLALLDLLFIAFIAVQARYLFGGDGTVLATAGLTYAEYAKRGFFELVFATALVIPVLLSINLLMRRDTPAQQRAFRWLAGLLALLVGLVMLSAAHRMRLYQQAYGLTESRLYASAFMIWIALVLAWFGRTVLIGRGRRFAAGTVVSAWLVLAALNAINPDQLIVRTNLDRARAGQPFDLRYAASLSADAVPDVIEALRRFPPGALAPQSAKPPNPAVDNTNRCVVRDRLLRWATGDTGDWRSWNLGRSRARDAATRHVDVIEAIECNPVAREARPAAMPAPSPAAEGDAARPPVDGRTAPTTAEGGAGHPPASRASGT